MISVGEKSWNTGWRKHGNAFQNSKKRSIAVRVGRWVFGETFTMNWKRRTKHSPSMRISLQESTAMRLGVLGNLKLARSKPICPMRRRWVWSKASRLINVFLTTCIAGCRKRPSTVSKTCFAIISPIRSTGVSPLISPPKGRTTLGSHLFRDSGGVRGT